MYCTNFEVTHNYVNRILKINIVQDGKNIRDPTRLLILMEDSTFLTFKSILRFNFTTKKKLTNFIRNIK